MFCVGRPTILVPDPIKLNVSEGRGNGAMLVLSKVVCNRHLVRTVIEYQCVKVRKHGQQPNQESLHVTAIHPNDKPILSQLQYSQSSCKKTVGRTQKIEDILDITLCLKYHIEISQDFIFM